MFFHFLQSPTRTKMSSNDRGKFPFGSEHCTPPLGVFGAWWPWLTNRKTIFKNHLQKQQILLPPCTALEKQCQHVSSEDWFSAGLRAPAKKPQLALEAMVSSIASTSGTVICLGQSQARKRFLQKPSDRCKSECWGGKQSVCWSSSGHWCLIAVDVWTREQLNCLSLENLEMFS